MDEQLLIDGCKRGEASARKELYELYAPAMMSVCARYVHDRETARDLLQDGFIKVFTKIQTYSATGPFGAWLRRVFVTTALEYLRKYDALRSSAPIDEYGEQVGRRGCFRTGPSVGRRFTGMHLPVAHRLPDCLQPVCHRRIYA